MALFDTCWYCNAGNQSTTGYYAVTKWAVTTVIAAGALRRQNTAPAVGSERVFICIVAGTTGSSEPTWVLTRGAKTTDGTVTWQECTGASAVNGDAANTPTWAAAKAISSAVTLGAIIKRANGASYWICSTAGTVGASEPAWANDTAGTTQADSTVTWTCLGVVGNFSGGGAPHARLANACTSTWFANGNTLYVGDNHAESQATTITPAIPASGAVLNKWLCHNHSGSYPPAAGDLTSGATVTTTAASAGISITGSGQLYVYGATFQAGSGASSGTSNITLGAASAGFVFDNCSFQTLNTASGSSIGLGGAGGGAVLVFNNTTFKFGNTGHFIAAGGNTGVYTWQNTAPGLASGSSLPTSLFSFNLANAEVILNVEAVDLSAVAGNLLNFSQSLEGSFVFKDCKLNASATVIAGGNPLNRPGCVVQLVRCDSGAAGYKSERYASEGAETTETSITRVGGATDPTGQAQSRKIVTSANPTWIIPFKAEPYAIWNPTTGTNVTATVCGTINAGALPNNDDIWLEVEYLGNASFPIGTIVNTTKTSILAANAAVASDGSTWNGGGSGVGWTPFKLTATLSSPQPGMAGYIEARVRVAKLSTTYYLDPKLVLT